MLCLKIQKTCWIYSLSPSLFLLLKLENIWFRTNYGYAFEGLLLWVRFVRRRKLCVFEICWTFSLVNVISRTFSSREIDSKDAFGWYVKWRSLRRVINVVLCCYKIPLYGGFAFNPRHVLKPLAQRLILVKISRSSKLLKKLDLLCNLIGKQHTQPDLFAIDHHRL